MDRGKLGRSCEVMDTNGPIPADEGDSPFKRVEDGVPCVDVGLRDEPDQVGRGAVRPGAVCKAGLDVVELEPCAVVDVAASSPRASSSRLCSIACWAPAIAFA